MSITYSALFIFIIVCISHLDALLVERVLIKVKDGRLDGARGRKHCQTDVDGVAPLRIQNNDLLPFAVCCCFLGHRFRDRVSAGFSFPLSLSAYFVCGQIYGFMGIREPITQVTLAAAVRTIWIVGAVNTMESVQYVCLCMGGCMSTNIQSLYANT